MVWSSSWPLVVVMELFQFFFKIFFPPKFFIVAEFLTMTLRLLLFIGFFTDWSENEQQWSSVHGGCTGACKSRACHKFNWVPSKIRERSKDKARERSGDSSRGRPIGQQEACRDHDHGHLHPWWELPQGCFLEFKVSEGRARWVWCNRR